MHHRIASATFGALILILAVASLALAQTGPKAKAKSPKDQGADAPRSPAVAFEPAPCSFPYQPPRLGAIAMSADNKWLATTSSLATYGNSPLEKGESVVWDLVSRAPRIVVPAKTWVRTVAFSPDSKLLAMATYDGLVELVDLEQGKSVARWQGHNEWVYSVEFSRDGKMLVSCSRDRTIKLWDVASRKLLKSLRGEAAQAHAAFSPDGTKLLCGEWESKLAIIWDVASGKQLWQLKGHGQPIVATAFSPDGKYAVTSSWDAIRFWDVESGQERVAVQDAVRGRGIGTCLAFDPTGKILASCGFGGHVSIWGFPSGKLLRTFQAHDGSANGLAYSVDGRTLATAGFDRSVKLWDTKTWSEIATLRRASDEVDEPQPILAVACSRDGETIAAAGEQGVRVYDATTGKLRHVLRGHSERVASVAFSPDGALLATASFDHTVKLWDVASGQERRTLSGHAKWVCGVAFSPDGKTLASCAYDRTVRLWGAASGEPLGVLQGHTAAVRCLAFSPDGKLLATGSSDETVKLWNVAERRDTATLRGHIAPVRGVAFAPDSAILASVGEDELLRLWDVRTAKMRADLPNIRDNTSGSQSARATAWCMAFHPREGVLATAGANNSVRLWNVESRTVTTTLAAHADAVTCVAFSSDGRFLVSGSLDKTVKVWAAKPSK